jgi:hypothetical protein
MEPLTQYYQQVRLYDKNLVSDSGEQGSLRHANEILSRRFSRRFRPYLSHGPRVVVKHIHQEVAAAFAEDLHVARKRRFRESRHGEGSISYHWLCASYQVERWREALLWGFIVARLGTESDPDRVLEAVWSTKECQPTFEDFSKSSMTQLNSFHPWPSPSPALARTAQTGMPLVRAVLPKYGCSAVQGCGLGQCSMW